MKNQTGQSLIEMIVVIGIVVLLVTGILAGTTSSLGRANILQIRSKALSYAEVGIELARAKRDDSWDAFKAMGDSHSTYCVGIDGTWGSPQTSCTTSNIDNTFVRSVTLESTTVSGVPTIKVTSKVTWGDSEVHAGNSTNVALTTYLTQWRGL